MSYCHIIDVTEQQYLRQGILSMHYLCHSIKSSRICALVHKNTFFGKEVCDLQLMLTHFNNCRRDKISGIVSQFAIKKWPSC